MQNHGLIVGGPNLRHTIDMTLIIEHTADKLIACHMLGKTPPVLPDEIVSTDSEARQTSHSLTPLIVRAPREAFLNSSFRNSHGCLRDEWGSNDS